MTQLTGVYSLLMKVAVYFTVGSSLKLSVVTMSTPVRKLVYLPLLVTRYIHRFVERYPHAVGTGTVYYIIFSIDQSLLHVCELMHFLYCM